MLCKLLHRDACDMWACQLQRSTVLYHNGAILVQHFIVHAANGCSFVKAATALPPFCDRNALEIPNLKWLKLVKKRDLHRHAGRASAKAGKKGCHAFDAHMQHANMFVMLVAGAILPGWPLAGERVF